MSDLDISVQKLYTLSDNLNSLDNIKKKISGLEKRKLELSKKAKPFSERKLEERDFYERTKRMIRDEEDLRRRKAREKENTRIVITYVFFILLGVLLCGLLEYLNAKYAFPFLTNWLKERWWVFLLKYTPSRGEAMYYFTLFVWSLAYIVLVFGTSEEHPVIGYIINGLLAIFAIYCLICYFKAAGFWLGLVLWVALIFCGIGHLALLGLLNFIPYALFPALLFLPYLFYLLAEVIADNIDVRVKYDFSKILSSQAYNKALELDKKDAPEKHKTYLKNYEDRKNAQNALCDNIKKQIGEYNVLISESNKIKSKIELDIRNNDVLHPNEKNRDTVGKLIYFIAHKRASTVKEALNCLAQAQYNEMLKKQIDNYIKTTQDFSRDVQEKLKNYRTETQQAFGNLEKRISEAERNYAISEAEAAARVEKAEREMNSQLRDTINERLKSIQADQEINKYQALSQLSAAQSEINRIAKKL